MAESGIKHIRINGIRPNTEYVLPWPDGRCHILIISVINQNLLKIYWNFIASIFEVSILELNIRAGTVSRNYFSPCPFLTLFFRQRFWSIPLRIPTHIDEFIQNVDLIRKFKLAKSVKYVTNKQLGSIMAPSHATHANRSSEGLFLKII